MLGSAARKTLTAVAETLVPPDGSIPQSASDLGLPQQLIDEVNGYPPRAHRRMRLLLFATTWLPLVSGKTRHFAGLSPEDRTEVLERNGRHKRSPLRRLIVSYLKQLVYSSYISQAPVEDAVGYRYECLRPRPGVAATGGRVHH